MTKKYSPEQIKECKDYLNFSVKEGYLDEDSAQDLIRTENWYAVYHMMDEGDFYETENYENNKI